MREPFSKIIAGCGIALSLALMPRAAAARPVTLSTTLDGFGGAAYVALYLTDAEGHFQSTLWVSGYQSQYYNHLRSWNRSHNAFYDGVTGASVGAGRTLKVNADIADALIDAGYQIRIDTAVENYGEKSPDIIVPLGQDSVGKTLPGKSYVKSFRLDM